MTRALDISPIARRGAVCAMALLGLLAALTSTQSASAHVYPPLIAFDDQNAGFYNTNGVFLIRPGASSSDESLIAGPDYCCPAWSPNGRRLALVHHYFDDKSQNHSSIQLTDRFGHPVREYTDPEFDSGRIGRLTWSPDGHEIAYECNLTFVGDTQSGDYYSKYQLCALDVATGQHHQITRTTDVHGLGGPRIGLEQQLSWRNGEIVAVVNEAVSCSAPGPECAKYEIGVVNAASGNYTVLRPGGESPSFSPDGTKIVYYEGKHEGLSSYGPTGIVVMRSNGDDPHTIVSLAEQQGSFPSGPWADPIFSPNGQEVLFSGDGQGDEQGYQQLFVVDADGGQTTQWSHHPAGADRPAWTPPLTTCTVPNVVGKTLASAKAALATANCALGKVSGPKKHRAKRHITEQSRKPGLELEDGAAVNVTVA